MHIYVCVMPKKIYFNGKNLLKNWHNAYLGKEGRKKRADYRLLQSNFKQQAKTFHLYKILLNMSKKMSNHFQKIKDKCYRKVYSYQCANHPKTKIVSTRQYPLVCMQHTPIYLFNGMDNKDFVHFHWVSNMKFQSFFLKKKKKKSFQKKKCLNIFSQ